MNRVTRHKIRAFARRLMVVALALAVGVSLSACGKRGSPESPPGQKNEYPRSYPDPKSY